MASPSVRTDEGSDQLSRVDYWLARSAASYAAFWEYPVRAMGRSWVRWDDVWAADPQSPSPIPNGATLLRPLACIIHEGRNPLTPRATIAPYR
jgi:hypothetical protein